MCYNIKIMKYTVTWYCSKNAGRIGSVDNILQIGDVAIDGLHPKKKGKGKAEFTYVEFLGKVYRVADRCDLPNNVDIYQGEKNKCDCMTKSPHPARNQQNGGYELKILYKKIETYEDQDN